MLRAYTGKDLQHAMQIMQMCLREDKSLEQCIKLTQADYQSERITNPCPKCGKQMRPIAALEGLKRIGCSCHYTEVVKYV